MVAPRPYLFTISFAAREATIFSKRASPAWFRVFRDATIQENNIVRTVASAAGTLSSIIFVLPGLIIIGDLCSAEAASEL